ncbi:aspartate/glutamate racemase family protein [Limibaculum sp. FT325]|uniref:glutamate racemase n=1 Tax=Thermohalobaculum sediminis TaxID=2939436 RepID=UPI0020C07922|nr:aspartate/glutamate racemase family protein [Limibaculum sediminis]MCL5777281.1 aspartate/glutamate racemase family protein [Limibaculum sediminis]
MPIGVFDSGLGGLTVLGALRRRLPGERFVYFGDNANAPYGTRSDPEIIALTRAGIERLFARGCDLVILACNTASAVALRTLQESWLPAAAPGSRVLGVFVPMIEAVTGRPWGYAGPPLPARIRDVAFFGTPATVRSGAFTRELGLRATGLAVREIACPGLVDAIEGGDAEGARRIVGACVDRLMAGGAPEAAILGCTHYPLVEPDFRAALPPRTRILSQPEIVAESLADYLRRHPRLASTDGPGGVIALTSGDPVRVAAGARRFAGTDLAFRAA